MSDFLDRLILKSAGSLTGVTPRSTSAYEPVRSHSPAPFIEHSDERIQARESIQAAASQRQAGRNTIVEARPVDRRSAPRARESSPGKPADPAYDISTVEREHAPMSMTPSQSGDEGRVASEQSRDDEQSRKKELVSGERVQRELPEAEHIEERIFLSVKNTGAPAPQPERSDAPAVDQQQPANSILKKFREQVEAQSGRRAFEVKLRAMDQPQAAEQSTPRTIKVTIGRIDVRANFEQPPKPQRTEPVRSTMSLDEYLKKRGEK